MLTLLLYKILIIKFLNTNSVEIMLSYVNPFLVF